MLPNEIVLHILSCYAEEALENDVDLSEHFKPIALTSHQWRACAAHVYRKAARQRIVEKLDAFLLHHQKSLMSFHQNHVVGVMNAKQKYEHVYWSDANTGWRCWQTLQRPPTVESIVAWVSKDDMIFKSIDVQAEAPQ